MKEENLLAIERRVALPVHNSSKNLRPLVRIGFSTIHWLWLLVSGHIIVIPTVSSKRTYFVSPTALSTLRETWNGEPSPKWMEIHIST